MDKAALYITKADIILVYIDTVDSLYTIILLFSYNLDISLNLFSIFINSNIDLEVLNISHKLSLDNIDCYLLLISDI